MAGKNNARVFAKFREQIAEIEEKFVPELLQNVAKALDDEVKKEFRNSQDPDGVAWQVKHKKDHRILDDTGRLRRSFESKVEGDKVVVKSELYAIFQQGARQMLPRRNRIGRLWAKRIRAEIRKLKKKYAAK